LAARLASPVGPRNASCYEHLRASAAIDYKSEDVSRRLAELCPQGVDLFFDNVGGEVAHAVMQNIASMVASRLWEVSAPTAANQRQDREDMMQWSNSSRPYSGLRLGDFAQEAAKSRAGSQAWTASASSAPGDLRRGLESARAFSGFVLRAT